MIGLAVAGLVATLLTWAVASGGFAVAGFDATVTGMTRGWADALGWPVDVAHVIGRVTAPLWSSMAAAVLVLWLFAVGHRAAAGVLALAGIVGVITSETVKRLVARPRPPGAEEYAADLDRSFPSGHAMAGIYLFVAAGLALTHIGRATGRDWTKRLGLTLTVIGPVIGLSRLVLGVHWPSDVLGGWAYGCVVLCTAALMLWAPLARGWGRPTVSSRPLGPPGASTTPDPPGR